MSVTITLPGALQELADGRSSLTLASAPGTLAEAMATLHETWPAVYDRIMTEKREVRPHVNLFIDEREIRHTGGLETPLEEGAEILVLPAVSGG